MPAIYLALTDIVNFGVRHTLDSGDFLFVDDLAVIGSLDVETVLGIGSGASAMIAGDLVSIATTCPTLQFSAAPNTTVTLGEGGSVWGSGSATIAAVHGGAGFRLISQGSIQAPFGIGVLLGDSGGSIDNRGTISGGSNGVVMAGADQTLINQGALSGGTTAGPNSAYGHGVQISGNGAVVSNWGSLTAAATGGSAINVAGGGGPALTGVRVENHGTMASLRGVAVDVSENTGVGITLVNSGTISGATGAFLGSSGASTVINSGTMIGAVTFGTGSDIYDGRGRSLADKVFGGTGNDTMTGGIYGDCFVGGVGFDSLVGAGGDDSLYGDQTSDTLRGGAGDDILFGGAHNDNLFGGDGDDTLQGDSEIDVMTGGAGIDTFRFTLATSSGTGSSRDRIVDFQADDDIIDVVGFLAGGTFIGETAFGSVAKQIRYTAANGIVAADVDGNGVADFEIRLSNRPTELFEDNFLL